MPGKSAAMNTGSPILKPYMYSCMMGYANVEDLS